MIRRFFESVNIEKAGLVTLGSAVALGIVLGMGVITVGSRFIQLPGLGESNRNRIQTLEVDFSTLRREFDARVQEGGQLATIAGAQLESMRAKVDSLHVTVADLREMLYRMYCLEIPEVVCEETTTYRPVVP